jgi:hypothetical protein
MAELKRSRHGDTEKGRTQERAVFFSHRLIVIFLLLFARRFSSVGVSLEHSSLRFPLRLLICRLTHMKLGWHLRDRERSRTLQKSR